MKYLDCLLQRWRIRMAAPYIPRGASVLDIGSADGALFREIPGLKDSVGIDPDLDHGSLFNALGVSFYRGLFPDALPAPRTFDVITMLATLEHIPENGLDPLARACAAHSRAGGLLIISVPSPHVDHVLTVLRALKMIHGMALEQHHGFDVRQTPGIFEPNFSLVAHRKFQLGMNNLFVFRRASGHTQ